MQLVVSTMQVDSWGLLGFRPQKVPSLKRLISVEGKINSLIHCFVGIRRITTLYDLEVQICMNEGIRQFEELELGPLHQHPLAVHYFLVKPNAGGVFKITTDEIILDLSEFMDICQQRSIEADEFLDYVAKKRSIKEKEMLGVRIQSLGMHVSFIREAKGSENESLKKSRELLCKKNSVSVEIKKDIRERFSSISQRIDSFLSVHTEFCGKHIRFASSSSEDESDNNLNDEGRSSSLKFPSCNMNGSDRISSCPYPSATEEFSRLGLKSETCGHSSAGGSSMNRKRKQPSKDKRKNVDPNCGDSLDQPCKLLKGEAGSQTIQSNENNARSMEKTCESDMILSYNSMKSFISTWKEACKQQNVVQVFEGMLQFYNPSNQKKGTRRAEKIKSMFSSYPFIGLLNVAVTSIKYGMWDNVYDAFQAFTQHDAASTVKCPDFEIIDVEEDEKGTDFISVTSMQQKCCMAVEDIITKITRYCELNNQLPTDCKLPVENNLTSSRKLHGCEMWLVKQFNVKDFNSLGHGAFLTFLEKHASLLAASLENLLSGGKNSPLEVSMVQQQLIALVAQASNCVWDGESISKEMISSLLKRQFPLLGFKIIENGPLDNFLEMVDNLKTNVISKHVLYSATLLKNCAVGDQLLDKRESASQATGVEISLPRTISLQSVISKDAIEVLLGAPMLSDLTSWSSWDVKFAPLLGPLVDWLLLEINSTELFCLVTRDGNVIKIDQFATTDSFLEAAIQKSPFQTAVNLLSVLSLAGGEKHAPLSLLKSYACHAFQEILKNYVDTGVIQGTEDETWQEKNVKTMNQGVNVASRFVLDCLTYMPSEFCDFAADVLLSGMQSVVRHASLAILSECNERERLMLHKIGLSSGIEDWINHCHASCSNTANMSGSSQHTCSEAKRHELTKCLTYVKNFCGEIAKFSNEDGDINCKIDSSVTSGERIDNLCSGKVSDTENVDAADVVESIRRDEFGLDPSLSWMERCMLKKHHARLGRALHCLSQELYSQDSHFLLELVQNADDNIYPQDVEPTLLFILRDSGIVILNNEQGFLAQNIRALCDVGNSTKKGSGGGYIGQKGIGFKSVFRITDAPEIHSNGFHIKFDVSEGQIGFVLPTIVPPCNIDSFSRLLADANKMDSLSWRTCILLPFRSKFSKKTAMEIFLDLHPSLLLFLHRLQCIIFRNMLNDSLIVMRKETLRDGIVTVSCGEDKMTWLVASQKLHGHDSRPKVKTTEIAIAFTLELLDDGTYVPCLVQQPVFSFLPLRNYGLKFIVHADFILPSSREEVDKNNAWNQWLLTKFPALFVSAEKLFCNLPCFRECTGKAVAAYMSFVPLVGEVQGFFSGLPRAIIMELQRKPCLLVEGDNSKMVTPCDLVRGWNEEARRVLPDGLLQELLGLGFLDRNIILSDSIARALGVAEYGAEILIKFMAALCRKQNGVESMGISWLSSWLSCLYTMLLSSPGKTEILEKLHCIPFIPLSDGTYSSIDAGAIWLHSDGSSGGLDGVVQGLEVFPMLFAKLRTVSPILLTASEIDRAVADNSILMLLQVGVRQLSAHEIMKINVLPALLDNKSTTLDEVLMCEYVCFVMIHLQSSCPHCPAERKNIISELEIRAFIMTNYGFKSPKETAIHFSKEFGNPVDIYKLLDIGNMDWPEVDTIYLRHPSNRLVLSAVDKWREFFLEFGVTDFVQVSLVDKSVTDLSINALKNSQEKDIISTLTVAKDWDSPELAHLLRLVLTTGNKECAKYVLEVLDILWDESFSDKTTGYYSSNPNVDKISFKSTFMSIVCDIEWVASSMDGMLHHPKDLFYDCDAVRSILGTSAPYALPKVRSQKLLSDIGFKTAVDVSDVLEILKVKGKSETAFQASMKEMSDLYMFIWKENTASKTKLLEDKMPFIFVPYNTGSTYQELVYGVFLTSEEVYWHDPTGCVDLLKDVCPQSSSKVRSRRPLRKTLCNIYPGLRDFFVDKCGVHENPSLHGYLDILRRLSSTTPAIQAGSAVFQVLLKWTDGLKSGLLCSEDITYLRECLREKKYRVLPTVQYRWVSMHSYFGVVCWCDDEELWWRYKSSDNLHILFFGNFGEEQQNVTQSKVSLFLQKMGIPALSEVIIREPVFYGVRSSSSKTLLINWALPYAQRYLYSLHLEKYMQLKQSGFDCIMQLQVAVVAKLFYRTRVQGCKNTYNERFKCDCLLQDNTLYSTVDSDLHTLFLELSRLFFDGKPELHIANFLHMISTLVESGSSEDQIEFFVSNSQKVPKLPDEETVWFISSIDRLTNELVKGGNPLTGKDVLAEGRDPSTKKDEKFSKLNKPRKSSNWSPSNWKTAPDSDYARVNGFKTQVAVLRSTNSLGKIREELSSYVVSDQADVVVSDHANLVISDQADELPFHLDAEWEIEENTTSISLKSKDRESYLGDVCEQTTDVDRALQPAGFQPLSAGSELSSSRSRGGNQDSEAATSEAILTGKLGEHVAFEYLTGKYGKESVRWVNEDYETGLPYDIIIGDEESNREYIEVKATRYARKDWFTISMREWQFAVEKAESFSIMHVVLSGDKNARVTIFKNPAKLCQRRQLQLVIMMHSKENS